MRGIPGHVRAATILAPVLAVVFGLTSAGICAGQRNGTGSQGQLQLTFDSDASAAHRFMAIPGRRALVDGYTNGALEVWAYPFQILSRYRVAFRESGTTTAMDGQEILSRVLFEPGKITRIYMGPDFIVRESLTVPLDLPGAILTYQVAGGHSVEIEVHSTPVLDLMWPGALGGQTTAWTPSLSAFVLSEPGDGFSAVVGSPEIVAHDPVDNRTVSDQSSRSLGFTLQPDHAGTAHVYVALNPPHAKDPGALFLRLDHERTQLEAAAATHMRELLRDSLRVDTPDAQVNQAIAWSEIDLDQAWVCNPDLGCGFVAGYGPSRGARRPQYDWFFAGDGLVAAEASISAGDFSRARQELEFILRYQDPRSGMIWHELSQSAGLIDWAGKFPYMFVHVDVSFQFVSTVEHYISSSGDTEFLKKNWKSIASAFDYCRSVIDPATGLPHIPADKEGGDEQDRIADELGLSASWVQASSQFAHLASLAGQPAVADQAMTASHLAAAAIPSRYWSAEDNFWVSGHSASGQNEPERRSSPPEAIDLGLFSPEQNRALLDQLASSSFQTDWGTRSVAAGSTGYDPTSYAKGSVWAVGTASLARTFWSQHRPVTAMALWQALLPWSWLDSPGHLHEVLAGDVYRPQGESVPEQTWSSAGFLSATVHGLLGLEVDGLANRITFAPHLPALWDRVSIQNIHALKTSLNLMLERTPEGLTLHIENPGPACSLIFLPQLPLGAHVGSASLDGEPISMTLEEHPEETDARMSLTAAHGTSELRIKVLGGVSIIPVLSRLQLGEASTGVRIVATNLAKNILNIEADVRSDRVSEIQLQTGWAIARVQGAELGPARNGLFTLTVPADVVQSSQGSYHRARIVVDFNR